MASGAATGGFSSRTPELSSISRDHWAQMACGWWHQVPDTVWGLQASKDHSSPSGQPPILSHQPCHIQLSSIPTLCSCCFPQLPVPTSPYHPVPYPFILQKPPLLISLRAAKYFQKNCTKACYDLSFGSCNPGWAPVPSWQSLSAFPCPCTLLPLSTVSCPNAHHSLQEDPHHMPSSLLTILYHSRGPWPQFDWEPPGGPVMSIKSLGSPSSSSLWPTLFPVPLHLDAVFPIHPGFWLHHLFLLLHIPLNFSWLLYCSLSCHHSLPVKATKHSKHFCDLVYPSRNLLSLLLLSSLKICTFKLDYLAHSHLL